jgi:hypothetical protein
MVGWRIRQSVEAIAESQRAWRNEIEVKVELVLL